MTKEELAAILNGRQYSEEITEGEEDAAEESGLVVVFGYSDDLMELRGAIYDEYDCWNGGTALINKTGVLPDRDNIEEDEELEEWQQRKKTAKQIKAIWAPKKPSCSWMYQTDIPHATFDIMEDGELYCRGIVFSIEDLK